MCLWHPGPRPLSVPVSVSADGEELESLITQSGCLFDGFCFV